MEQGFKQNGQENPDEQKQVVPSSFDVPQVETPIPNVDRAGKLTPGQEEDLRKELEKYK